MSLKSKRRAKAMVKKEMRIEHVRLLKPTGPVPESSVISRHGSGMIMRGSKGFSIGEVGASGVSMTNAKNWGLPLDLRRRSVLQDNVDGLKSWAAKATEAKKEGEVKKLEEELEKVEKEVKKGVAKVKKEVKRAEREVEKVEKEAIEKVEKPVKARGRKKKVSKKE